MASKFHFFTDTNLLLSQSASDAFGPGGTDGAGNDQYRISSMHSASADPAAYAVCSGIVCAQDIPNTTPPRVNLILKPLDRPPINFVPIRYYIYKGIRKDSLFNGAAIAPSATNDLTKAIWNSQDAKNKSANTPNVPAPAEALGIDLTAALDSAAYGDAKPIDNLFYRTEVDAQFPHVKGGWKIGIFDKTRFGFEILLDGLGHRHDLALVRNLEDSVKVATLPSSPTSDQVFAHWHEKEKVLGFLDPCAFYGSFYGSRIRAKSSTGSFDVKKGDSLYNAVVALFLNKNRTYVDIRNERNNSFDYFNNYGRDLQVAYDATTASAQANYYAAGWPVLIIEGSQFNVNNTGNFNTLRIALPVGDNSQPLLYLSQGYKSKGSSPFKRELSSADKVVGMNLQQGATMTDDVALALPNLGSSTAAQPIACYVRLKYFKRIESGATVTPGSPATIVTANYLDNVFSLLDLKPTLSGPSTIKSAVWDEEIYVDATAALGIDFIGKVGFATDTSNVTLFAFPSFVITRAGGGKSIPFSITGEGFDGADTYLNKLVAKYDPKTIEKHVIVGNPTPGDDLDAIAVSRNPEKDGRFASPNFDHFIALVFGNAVYQSFLSLAASSFLPGYPVYLGVKRITTQADAVGVDYTSYEVVLRGYVVANGRIEVKEQNTDPASTPPYTQNIKVYSQ
jgi:hypothetical protein